MFLSSIIMVKYIIKTINSKNKELYEYNVFKILIKEVYLILNSCSHVQKTQI